MMFDRPARRGTALADEGSLSVQASTIGLCRRVAEAKGIARCDGREVFFVSKDHRKPETYRATLCD